MARWSRGEEFEDREKSRDEKAAREERKRKRLLKRNTHRLPRVLSLHCHTLLRVVYPSTTVTFSAFIAFFFPLFFKNARIFKNYLRQIKSKKMIVYGYERTTYRASCIKLNFVRGEPKRWCTVCVRYTRTRTIRNDGFKRPCSLCAYIFFFSAARGVLALHRYTS